MTGIAALLVSRSRLWVLTMVLAGLPAPATVGAQEPEQVLQDQGLKKVGTGYVLPSEAELTRSLATLRKLWKEYGQAATMLRTAEQESRAARNLIPRLVEQRLFLNQQLRQAQQGGVGTQQYNQIVVNFNEINDRINLLQLQSNDTQALREVRDREAQKRDAIIQSSMAIREIVDQADARYEELAGSTPIREAIDQINTQAKAPVSLGPSRTYQAGRKAFERFAAGVLSETIPARAEGGVRLVDVTLNGKVTKAMVFDTGASMVSLPADLATAAGVAIGPDAPRIQVTVADGRKFEAHQGVLNSVRLGKFNVEQVDCIVMPAEFANAPALLGGSFLRNFTTKLDQAGQSVTLSRVEEEPAPARAGKKR